MIRSPQTKSDIGNNDEMQVPSSESNVDSAISKASTVKMWVFNTDLKYAIVDLRKQLMNEAKNTNPAMKQKIQDWVTRDFTNDANLINAKKTLVAKENEAMRQLISDLLNGPIGSLLNKDGRNKLHRLSIPTLPDTGIFIYDNAHYDDRDSIHPLRSRPSFNSSSYTSSIGSYGDYTLDS